MRKIIIACVLFLGLSYQYSYANNDMFSDSNACGVIAKACKKAGYKKDKNFWFECMKPIVMGKSVAGVKIDADTVKQCRADKIEKMKKELDELQSVS